MSDDRVREVMGVVVDALVEVGYDRLTMDLIAERAHCGKPTLYRHWGSRSGLVVAALRSSVMSMTLATSAGSSEAGDLRSDLLAMCATYVSTAQRDVALVSALQHAVLNDLEVARAMQGVFVTPNKVHLAAVIERALGRGELVEVPDAVELLPELFFGVIVGRQVTSGIVADGPYLERFVDEVVLPALVAGGAGR